MAPVGFQEGAEKSWWWKVALHLDEAQIALANAVAHNVDDPRLSHVLYDKLREGQGVLLQIFAAKGLLPSAPNAPNGKHVVPPPVMSVMSEPAVPEQMITDAEIVDDPPEPLEAVSEGYAAQGTSDPESATEGSVVEATAEPVATAPPETLAADPVAEPVAEPVVEQPPLAADVQQAVVVEGDRTE